jgi:SAM-dependent MidA family methyltransferase
VHAFYPTPLKTPLSARDRATLPRPDADALAHTNACAAMIRDAIRGEGGVISFAKFMELALYAPGLGYYAAGARKFGAAGDFITAPEISPLFGQCVARSIADTILETGGDVLELGPGSGKLACDMLVELDQLGALPKKYQLLEVSADLRERQTQALARLPKHLSARAVWLDRLPDNFSGAVVANEVLDVVPVHLVCFSHGHWQERGVALGDNEQFVWRDLPLPRALEGAVAHVSAQFPDGQVPPGYLTEVAPAVDGLVTSLSQTLARGVMLLIDYGFRAAEFYHPSRGEGTLMCHFRHFARADPFLYPGLQDITAHVDFTRVAEVATAQGLELINYCTQAQFLMAAGIAERMSALNVVDTASYLTVSNQLQRLMSPAEMGEFFKVIAFDKGVSPPLGLAAARPLPL